MIYDCYCILPLNKTEAKTFIKKKRNAVLFYAGPLKKGQLRTLPQILYWKSLWTSNKINMYLAVSSTLGSFMSGLFFVQCKIVLCEDHSLIKFLPYIYLFFLLSNACFFIDLPFSQTFSKLWKSIMKAIIKNLIHTCLKLWSSEQIVFCRASFPVKL